MHILRSFTLDIQCCKLVSYWSNCVLEYVFELLLSQTEFQCFQVGVSLAFHRLPSSLLPYTQLFGSFLTMTLSTSSLLVCFPNLIECQACVSPLPPACYQQKIDLLAPLKCLSACQALNQEDCQELGIFPRMIIVNSLLLPQTGKTKLSSHNI